MGGGSDQQVMMDDEASGSGDSARPNFTFAFNDSNFSDRVLRIEVVAAPPDAKTSAGGSAASDDWARHKKRRRADRGVAERIPDEQEEQVMNGNLDDAEDAPHDLEEDAAVIMEESMQSSPSPGLEEDTKGHNTWSTSSGPVVQTRLVHISSAILAAKSPFFYKLFSNGMRESEQRDVPIRITTSEEDALMDLLQFMYSGKLKAELPTAVLDVLMAADKFEVSSCMRHCSRLLRNLDMTPESALLYLELPSSVLLADAVQPLTDTARSFLATRYRDIARYAEDVLNLPLAGLEAVLSSDELQVASEDAVYDFVLKWAKIHIPKPEDRREVLGSRLAWLIRFPMMSSRKLRKVLTCSDFEHDFAQKLVVEALFFRTEPPHRQRQLALDEPHHKKFSERAYKYRPVKMVEFDRPFQHCHVYLDLKLDECKSLWPQGRLYSQAFHLGGQGFFLSAHCNMDQTSTSRCFGLFLGMQEKGSVSFLVDYEFSARMRPSWEFHPKSKGNYLFTGGKAVGYRNLFALPWEEFIDDGLYFHEGILHLRADLTIKSSGNNGNSSGKH